MKKKIIIISAVIYTIALLFLVTMYLKSDKSIQFYDSTLASYSQPLPAYSNNIETPNSETPDAKSLSIAAQVNDWNTFLTRNPTNSDMSNALLELAQKRDLKIISLAAKGDKKQTVIKGSYELRSFNILLAGSRQDLIDLLGDLQSFGPGVLVIDSVNLSEKKYVSQADISLTVYSREAKVKVDISEGAPVKEVSTTTINTNIKKVAGKQ